MTALAVIHQPQSQSLEIIRPTRRVSWFPDLDAAAQTVEKHVANLDSTKETKEKHTQEQYRRVIAGFIEWLNGDLPTAEVMESYLESLSQRKLSNVTINKYLAPIRIFLRALSRQPIHPEVSDRDFRTASQIKDLIAAAADIQVKVRKKSNQARVDQFNWRGTSDLLTIMHTIDQRSLRGKRDYAIFVLGINSALRVNEITNITLANFKRYSDNTALIVNLRGKGGMLDPIPVPLYVYDIVKAYMDAFNAALPKDDPRRIQPDQPLWKPLDGRGAIYSALTKNQPMGRKGVSRIIKARSKAAGKPMNPHDLRRSAVAYMRSLDMKPEEIMRVTRHQSLDMVTKYIGTEAQWDKFNHFLHPGAVKLA